MEPVSPKAWAGGSPASLMPWSVDRQAADRQEVVGPDNPVVVVAVVWLAAIVLLQLLPLLGPLVSSSEPGRLENDARCGITTGGEVGGSMVGPVIMGRLAG